MNTAIETVTKLPLWKNALDKMREKGIDHGQVWPAEFFEEHLKCNRREFRFGIDLSEIRRELERDGFYLSGRGQNGNQYVILPPEGNADVMLSYQRAAADALSRGVILGTNTRLDLLSESERKRHEGILERMAVKAVLLSRSGAVANVLKHHSPSLLNPKATNPEHHQP